MHIWSQLCQMEASSFKSLTYSSSKGRMQNYIGNNLVPATRMSIQQVGSTSASTMQLVGEKKKKRETHLESLVFRKFIEYNLVF